MIKARFTAEQREVILSRYANGESAQSTATLLNVTMRAVTGAIAGMKARGSEKTHKPPKPRGKRQPMGPNLAAAFPITKEMLMRGR